MPISQADLDHDQYHQRPVAPEPTVFEPSATRLRRLSEESIRTEFCEGPLPDSPQQPPPLPSLTTSRSDDVTAISDRVELIERLKRGESPTWVPNRHVNYFTRQTQRSPTEYAPGEPLQRNNGVTSPNRPQTPSSLLPPAQITPEKKDTQNEDDDRIRDGLNIERPRSALHSGDFTEDDERSGDRRTGRGEVELRKNHQIRSEASWIATSPPRHFTPFQFERRTPFSGGTDEFRPSYSPLSSSLSSNFVYKPPTSPLVQSQSNEDLDFSKPLDGIDFPSSRTGLRRYTCTSTTSSPFCSPSPTPVMLSRVPSYRREAYQAHQPRRSLTSTPNFMHSGTSPQQSPYLRSRRSSFVSDSSPLHHASMVGSYEESILRGRMSTTPSKPLDFVAQIGVLGKGKCKSSLKCPPHVTLSFPAVYYSYSSTTHGRSSSDDGPSPYVGQVDLENGLPNPDEEQRAKRKAQSRYGDRRPADDEMDVVTPSHSPEHEVRRNSRAKRHAASPKAPPGGSYRIPEKGQIQIIIKNPNKTAVKLFLVPYDLTGMEPGTKTFIRQRSYSAGPIIDNIPPTTVLDSSDRPILRYLVHLHICCPAKGRFYLYKSIRIVFANRVPDGKEKLRNETTWPEPRYTPYKSVRVMNLMQPTPSGPGATLAAEKAFRRRSSGFPICSSMQSFDVFEGMYHQPATTTHPTGPSSGGFAGGNTIPVDPIPFRLPSNRDRLNSDVSDTPSNLTSRPSTKDSVGAAPWGDTLYEKLNKGDLGYGGNAYTASVNGSPAGAEGLLSQRLRSLGVKAQDAEGGPRNEDAN